MSARAGWLARVARARGRGSAYGRESDLPGWQVLQQSRHAARKLQGCSPACGRQQATRARGGAARGARGLAPHPRPVVKLALLLAEQAPLLAQLLQLCARKAHRADGRQCTAHGARRGCAARGWAGARRGEGVGSTGARARSGSTKGAHTQRSNRSRQTNRTHGAPARNTPPPQPTRPHVPQRREHSQQRPTKRARCCAAVHTPPHTSKRYPRAPHCPHAEPVVERRRKPVRQSPNRALHMAADHA